LESASAVAKKGRGPANKKDRDERETNMRLLLRWAVALYCGSFLTVAVRAAELPDGTLLFLENCNSIVQRTTHGEIAHVAFVFQDGGESWVYEATPAKVRRVTVDEYLVELARLNKRRDDDDQIRVLALRPMPEYTSDEVAKMRAFLDGQLGRRYSVKNYVRGRPYDGVHCAELTSSTLNQSGRHTFQDCHSLSPQALYACASSTHEVAEQLSIPPLVTQDPWCLRAQRRWIATFNWCRWSCKEAWLFLW